MKACMGTILPSTWEPDPKVRQYNRLAARYAHRILQSFQIEFLHPAAVTLRKALIIVRKAGPHRGGTEFDDGSVEQLSKRLKKEANATVDSCDFAHLTYAEQIRRVRGSNLMIGVHGAGLTHVMYLPDKGGLLEITQWEPPFHSQWKGDVSVANIFMNLAAWTGHTYGSVQGTVEGKVMKFEEDHAVRKAKQLWTEVGISQIAMAEHGPTIAHVSVTPKGAAMREDERGQGLTQMMRQEGGRPSLKRMMKPLPTDSLQLHD